MCESRWRTVDEPPYSYSQYLVPETRDIKGFRSRGTVNLLRNCVKNTFIPLHFGRREQLTRNGRVKTRQLERREIESPLSIEELRKGRKGQVRTVVLRTSDGRQTTRPIQLVIPLEVDQGGEDVEERLSS